MILTSARKGWLGSQSDNTENKRCKDCKYFKKEALKRESDDSLF